MKSSISIVYHMMLYCYMKKLHYKKTEDPINTCSIVYFEETRSWHLVTKATVPRNHYFNSSHLPYVVVPLNIIELLNLQLFCALSILFYCLCSNICFLCYFACKFSCFIYERIRIKWNIFISTIRINFDLHIILRVFQM